MKRMLETDYQEVNIQIKIMSAALIITWRSELIKNE